MKVDLVMWTYNSAKTLAVVLSRIEKVIPKEVIHNKIIVDDFSTDNTRNIAESFGWNIHFKEGEKGGIGDSANTALKCVETEYFISFEHDLLLSYDWWRKIPIKFEDKMVVAVSGVRFASEPEYLRKLQQYVYKKYIGEKELVAWLRTRQMSAYTLGKTLDNTMWRTKFLRELGGFPTMKSNVGIDTLLAYKIGSSGFKWIVDYSVKSIHLRKGGLHEELLHQKWYAAGLKEIWRRIEQETTFKPPITSWSILSRLLYSPATGLFVAVKTHSPQLFIVHPLIRLFYFKGFSEGMKA